MKTQRIRPLRVASAQVLASQTQSARSRRAQDALLLSIGMKCVSLGCQRSSAAVMRVVAWTCFQKSPKQQQFDGFSCSGPTERCNTVGCAEGQTFIATRRKENYRSCGLPCRSRGSQAAPLSALQTGAVVTPKAEWKHFSFPLWWTAM